MALSAETKKTIESAVTHVRSAADLIHDCDLTTANLAEEPDAEIDAVWEILRAAAILLERIVDRP